MPKPKYRRFDDEEIDGFRFRLWDASEFCVKFVRDTSSSDILLDFNADNGHYFAHIHISDVPKLIQVLQEVLKQSTFKE